jgi:hypothetical protein
MVDHDYELMVLPPEDQKSADALVEAGYGDYFKNRECHRNAAGFNPADLGQYLFSFNYFPVHVDPTRKPITDLATGADRVYLTLMIVGGFCVLISNQLAYYILNKERLEQKEQKILLRPCHRRVMFVVASVSVIYKSLATSSSYFALWHDETAEPATLGINFGLAFVANVLAQSAIQGVTGGWHAGWRWWVACPVAVVSSLYYTSSLLALNYNTLVNAGLKFGLLDSRPQLSDREFLFTHFTIGVFFLGAGVRTCIVYFHRKYDRLLPKGQHQVVEKSVWHTGLGYVAGYQRSAMMLVALTSISYDLSRYRPLSIILAVASVMLCGMGTLKSNLAVFLPKGPAVVSLASGCSEAMSGALGRVRGFSQTIGSALTQCLSSARQALFSPRPARYDLLVEINQTQGL